MARNDFRERISARRKELGLSREDVALGTGVDLSYIRHLEESHDMPDSGFLGRLAATLRTSVAYLIGWENQPPDPQ
jgi:transcriptional regulator with XRE-family HTH domain